MTFREKSIPELINDEYRTYAIYTVANRALPSFMDGLKPVQRKILFYCIKNANSNRKKVAEIGGSLSSVNYHHGETAAQAATIKMAQTWSNNIPLLTGYGNFGSVLVQEAAAPRYIFAQLGDAHNVIFKDADVAPPSNDLEDPEPKYYLPIIPWVLINGVSGIAVGYSTNILPRDPKEVTKQCLNVLNGKKVGLPSIKFPCFSGTVEMEGNSATISGVLVDTKKGYTITELPVGYDREKYVTVLEKLVEDKVIDDYSDLCSGDGFKFEIICSRAQKAAIAKKDPLKALKLIKKETENFILLDDIMAPVERVIGFDDVTKYIESFVAMRSKFYKLRLDKQIAQAQEYLEHLNAKRTFVKAVLKKPDILKQTKAALISDLQATYNIPERFCNSVVSMPAYSLCTDKVKELEAEITKTETEIKTLKATKPTDVYRSELEALLKWL